MTRLTLPALALAATMFSTTSALAFDPADMSDSESAAFGDAVRAYLLDNPEVLVEAFQLLEQRNADQQAGADKQLVAMYADEIFDDGVSWVGGNPDGDVTLVEFMDYRCGYCRRAVPEVDSLLSTDGNIRLIIKEFPILGETSVISSRFAIATQMVAGDDAYKQVHDALIDYSGDMGDVALRRLAEGLGLDADPILQKMDSEEVSRVISDNRELARSLQINGTPTFVLGDELLRGYLPAAEMAKIVEDQRG